MSTPLPPGWSTFYDPSSGQWVYTNLQTGAQQYDPPIYDPQYAEIQAQDVEDYAQGATEETALAEQEYADAEECGDDGYGDPGTGAVDDGNWDTMGVDDGGSGYGDEEGEGYGDGGDDAAGGYLAQESQNDDLGEMDGNDNDGLSVCSGPDPATLPVG